MRNRQREAVHPHGTLAERKRRLDEALDDALAQCFPASDPIAVLISPKAGQGNGIRRTDSAVALVDGTGGTRKSPDIFVTTVDAARLSRVLEAFRDPSYTPLTEFLLANCSGLFSSNRAPFRKLS